MTKKKILERISDFLRRFLFSIIKFFFYGVIALIPILFIFWLLNFFAGIEAITLKTILKTILERIFTGVEISNWAVGITLFLIIIGIGTLSPLITGKIYSWIGKLIENLLKEKKVVVYEFKKGIWTLGFITGHVRNKGLKKEEFLIIFTPNAPIPITGLPLFFIRKKNVVPVKLSFPEVIQLITSGGILVPEKISGLAAELEKRERIKRKNKKKEKS